MSAAAPKAADEIPAGRDAGGMVRLPRPATARQTRPYATPTDDVAGNPVAWPAGFAADGGV
jgi:hypothetical protein